MQLDVIVATLTSSRLADAYQVITACAGATGLQCYNRWHICEVPAFRCRSRYRIDVDFCWLSTSRSLDRGLEIDRAGNDAAFRRVHSNAEKFRNYAVDFVAIDRAKTIGAGAGVRKVDKVATIESPMVDNIYAPVAIAGTQECTSRGGHGKFMISLSCGRQSPSTPIRTGQPAAMRAR